jgi:drug efflux transport system permease protein
MTAFVRRVSRIRRVRRFFSRVLALANKEWMHIVRDARTLYFALGMPVVMLVIFGYAVSFDIDDVPTVVVDQDQSAESRALIHHLFSGTTFRNEGQLADPRDVEAAFRRNDARMGVVIPLGYARSIGRGEEARVQLLVDAADNMTATSILSFATRFTISENERVVRKTLGVTPETIEPRVRALFNPGMKSALFLVPGLIALIQAMMAVLLTALTVAREWERGTMEQLFSTPVGRIEIVLGKLLPYFFVGMAQVLLVLASGTWLFGVPIRGPVVAVFGISAVFLLASLGQGLLISVATKNQQVATQGAAVSSMLPSALLSGFVMPIDNMPVVLQYVTYLIPARYYVHALRAILLRDAPLSVVAPDAVALLAFATATVIMSTALFRRRLA